MKDLLSFVGRGFFSWVSVFLSFVLSKEVTSETSGLSAIMKSYREREKTHLINRIHYNGWLQEGREEITRRKGGERKKRMASGACSHPPAAAIEAPLTFSELLTTKSKAETGQHSSRDREAIPIATDCEPSRAADWLWVGCRGSGRLRSGFWLASLLKSPSNA